jgi:hypothetical protein
MTGYGEVIPVKADRIIGSGLPTIHSQCVAETIEKPEPVHDQLHTLFL